MGGGEVETRRQKRVSFCIWSAGRKVRWRVLGLIIKAPEIGLFVCDPKRLLLAQTAKWGRRWEGRKGRRREREKEGGRRAGGGKGEGGNEGSGLEGEGAEG